MEGASDAAHGGTLLIGGQHLLFEFLRVAAIWGIGEAASAVLAAVARVAAGGAAEADDVVTLAVGAGEDLSYHAATIP